MNPDMKIHPVANRKAHAFLPICFYLTFTSIEQLPDSFSSILCFSLKFFDAVTVIMIIKSNQNQNQIKSSFSASMRPLIAAHEQMLLPSTFWNIISMDESPIVFRDKLILNFNHAVHRFWCHCTEIWIARSMRVHCFCLYTHLVLGR